MNSLPHKPALLRAEQIRRSYGSAPILNGVNLSLGAGTLTLLMGRNGSGKSTLVNCLTGFDLGYQGDVVVNGKPLKRFRPDQRARLGVVRTFQSPHLFKALTVREHLSLGKNASAAALPSYVRLAWRNDRIDDPISGLGIHDLLHRRAGELSFGEMKLVNIARAAMTGAQVLLFDEPLASLHGQKRDRVLQLIAAKRAAGCAVMVIEHDIDELSHLADTVLELRDGTLFG